MPTGNETKENKNIMELVEEFRCTAGITTEAFAIEAHMEKEILETMIATAPDLMAGTFSSIALAMQHIKNAVPSDTVPKLDRLYAAFIDTYITENPDEVASQTNPYFKEAIVSLAAKTGQPSLLHKTKSLLHMEETGQTEDAADMSAQLADFFAQLNPLGKEEAIKRVRELTFVPDYQLK